MTLLLWLNGCAVSLLVGIAIGVEIRRRRTLAQYKKGYMDGLKIGKFVETYSRPEGDGLTETERWKREYLAYCANVRAHPLGHQTFISAASEYEAFCRLTAPPRGR